MKSQYWIVIGLAGVLAAIWWQWPRVSVTTPTQPINLPVADAAASIADVDRQTKPVVSSAGPQQAKGVQPVSAAEEKPKQYPEWERELIASLIGLGDADSLLTAALILHELYAGERGERLRVESLLERAHAQAPGDRAIVSVAARMCGAIQGCKAARYEGVVRNIDPRNALGPLVEKLQIIEVGSSGQVTEALESLAPLRLNLYHAEVLQRVARAISSTPTTPRGAPDAVDLLRAQSELTLRVVNAIEVPSYLGIGPACQVKNWRNGLACERIARGLAQSELIELQRLGIGMSENLSGTQAKQDSELTQSERYLSWLGSEMTHRPPSAEQWIALLAQHRSEMAAARAWAQQNGVAPPTEPRWFGRVR